MNYRLPVLVILLITGHCLAQKTTSVQDTALRIITNRISKNKPDTVKLSLLLRAGNYLVNKPGSDATDINPALSFANQALDLALTLKNREQECRSYTLLSQIYRETADTLKGKKYVEKALANRSVSELASADAYFEAANYYNIETSASRKSKIYYYSIGVKKLESTNPTALRMAVSFKFMGDLYQCNGDYKIAIQFLQKALPLYQKAHHQNLQEIYSLIGNVFVQLGNQQDGIKYNLMAASAVERNKDSTMTACEIYGNLANSYNNLRDRANAIKYFKKAKLIALKNHETGAAQYILANLAEDYSNINPQQSLALVKEAFAIGPVKSTATNIVLTDELLKAYTHLKQYEQARTYYLALLDGFKSTKIDGDYRLGAYIDIIRYLIATRQNAALKKFRAEVVFSPDYKPALLPRLIIEHTAFRADSATGDYFSAMKHSQRYSQLNVDNLKKGYDNQVALLQVQYKTRSKDQDIAFKAQHINLLTHEIQLQKARLKDQQLIRNLFICGAILLVLLLGLGYSRYRVKKIANRDLLLQQQEIQIQNESLRQLVTERDWLLKEVHHRVKNNLQIVISLLNSQLYMVKDGTAKNLIRESQHRIHSISLIHQKLYQHNNMSGIGMHEYIRDLSIYLQESFDTYGLIDFSLDIQPLYLDVSQAVPLALITNEAITNAIKHAFGNRPKMARIVISLKNESDKIWLKVSDNGIGLPSDFNISSYKSLGMKLITGLTRQLKGELNLVNEEGLTVTITLKSATMLVDETDLIEEILI